MIRYDKKPWRKGWWNVVNNPLPRPYRVVTSGFRTSQGLFTSETTKIFQWSPTSWPSRLKYARNAGLDLMYLLGGWGDKLLQGILLKTELHPVDQTCGNVFNEMMFNVVHVHIWMILTGVVWFHIEPFILKKARWLYPFHHFYVLHNTKFADPPNLNNRWCGVV